MRGRAWIPELIGWAIVALVGAVALSQAVGWTATRNVAIVLSLTPYLGLVLVPLVIIACGSVGRLLATACARSASGSSSSPLPPAFPGDQPDPIADAVGLRVASVNLLYSNDRIDDVVATLHDLAPDVIVFNEYTAEHQSTLQSSALADDYPYRIDRTDRYAGGIALWSREPVTVGEHPTPTTTAST